METCKGKALKKKVGTEVRRKTIESVSNLESRRPKGNKTSDILGKHK